MKTEILIDALIRLGESLDSISKGKAVHKSDAMERVRNYSENPTFYNPWFTKEFVIMAISSVVRNLKPESLHTFMNSYKIENLYKTIKRVGVVSAGNIPAVGFHDFLCVLLTGNIYIGKLSSKDNVLIREFAKYLIECNSGFEKRISFTESPFTDIDAIIATGSNNTYRYFEYYFSKYPHIIRKNRNSIAIISGNESNEEIIDLGKDICSYFGLGCRNVSKIYVPASYPVRELIKQFEDYKYILDNHKYRNNYDYYKSIFLVNGDSFFDNGFQLVKQQTPVSSPVSVLHYEEYNYIEELKTEIELKQSEIQCIAGNTDTPGNVVPFGSTQYPSLFDFADDIDTMEFLINLK